MLWLVGDERRSLATFFSHSLFLFYFFFLLLFLTAKEATAILFVGIRLIRLIERQIDNAPAHRDLSRAKTEEGKRGKSFLMKKKRGGKGRERAGAFLTLLLLQGEITSRK